LKNVDEKGRPFPSVTVGQPLGRVAPSRTLLFDRLLDDLDFLVGQSVQFVDDLVDQIVGALDLSLQFLCPRFRLQIALQPLPNVPDGGQCQLSKSIDERVGLRRRLPELGEAAGLLDGDGDEVFG
jgi:hypothetical protein